MLFGWVAGWLASLRGHQDSNPNYAAVSRLLPASGLAIPLAKCDCEYPLSFWWRLLLDSVEVRWPAMNLAQASGRQVIGSCWLFINQAGLIIVVG